MSGSRSSRIHGHHRVRRKRSQFLSGMNERCASGVSERVSISFRGQQQRPSSHEPALKRRGPASEEICKTFFFPYAPDALDCCWISFVVWRWRVGALAVDEVMVHGIVLHLRIYPAFARVSKIVGLVRVVYIFQRRQKNHTL